MATVETRERRDPVYWLTVGYMVALVIIGVMSFCIHVILGRIVAEQNNSAVVVSAREANISQKIAFYASEYADSHDPVIADQLDESISHMRDIHSALVTGDPTLDIPQGMSEPLNRIYYSLPYNLDHKVNDFLEKAQAFRNMPPDQVSRNDENYRYLVEMARGPLMMALDAATTEYEAESDLRIGKLQSFQKMALFVIFATLLAEAVLIFRPLVMRVHNYAERLKRMAMTDGLTGIDNNRSFIQKSMKEIKRAKRHGKPLSVAILDLDHFKSINDRYGHLAGDEVLKAFAQFVLRSMRIEDEFARIGGEEFAVLLPHTNLDGARLVADRIRTMVEMSPVNYDNDEKQLFVTTSIGVAEVDPDALDIESAMEAADKALYQAKQQGRNRVCCSTVYTSAGNVIKMNAPKKG